jgi:hypothetical protein
MLATKMFSTAPEGPVREHLHGTKADVGAWPYGTSVCAADGTMLRVEWYPMTDTWIVFCD